MKDLRVFITGAAGFLGSHLGNELKALGAEPYGIALRAESYGIDSYLHASKNPLKFACERGDVRQKELLLMRAKDADVIVHLAAAINVDWSLVVPDLTFDINVGGTLNVLETARLLDKKVVFASSSEVYGASQTENGIDENHSLDGHSPYAASKIAGDRMCKAWRDSYGLDINIVRCFNTFGPWQGNDGYGAVVAKFTRQALAHKPMTVFGTGEQTRDFLYIDDAVQAYLLALTTTWDRPVNFGSGNTVSVLSIAKTISSELGGVFQFGPARPGEVTVLRANIDRARSLGWSPKVEFVDGLRRYIAWAKGQ